MIAKTDALAKETVLVIAGKNGEIVVRGPELPLDQMAWRGCLRFCAQLLVTEQSLHNRQTECDS